MCWFYNIIISCIINGWYLVLDLFQHNRTREKKALSSQGISTSNDTPPIFDDQTFVNGNENAFQQWNFVGKNLRDHIIVTKAFPLPIFTKVWS
mmetsp:Transcript_13554/g.15231  ORF Transcript_13554/g.15231 Transcript_13554/m.15231 type:complete len:93 (-) Transcript_13554:206-484(-)